VSDHDRGRPGLAQDRHRLVADRVAHAPVEVENGSSIRRHAGPGRDGARQRDALLLATGQRIRKAQGEVLEPDPRKRASGLHLGLGG
jgi:hypothetical protein